MTTAAILLPLLAWSMQRDPEAQAWAEAQAEMNALVPRLLAEVEVVRGELLADDDALLALFRSDLSEEGRLLELPVKEPAIPLERFMRNSPAEEWYSEGLRRLAEPTAALAAFESAADALPEESLALAVMVDLKRAEILQRLGRTEEVLALLKPRRTQIENAWTLRDLPVGLVLGYRVADALTDLEQLREADLVYQELQHQLLYGAWPLSETQVRVQLQFLRGGGDGTEVEQGLALRKTLALIPVMPIEPGMRLADDAILFVDTFQKRAAVFETAAVNALLSTRLKSLLPKERRFLLSETQAANLKSNLPNAKIDAASLLLPSVQVHLDDLSPFIDPLIQRQMLVFAVVLILAMGLLGLSWFGRRLLLREESLQRTRTEFLAGVSHELRTPAASLSMLSDNLLHGRVQGEERVQEYYRSMRRDARRLERLVADVLDVTRMDRGTFSIDRQECDLTPVLENLVEEQVPRLADACLKLTCEIVSPLPRLPLDAFAVERACANLIENAKRYASSGKCIALHAQTSESGGIVLRISDRGPGIPSAWSERVFEPYERLPQDQTLAAGAGLGLALVRAVMVAHDGKVWVEQGPENIGACFVLEFPAHA